MKTYEGVEVYLHAFFTLTVDGGNFSALRPGRFTFGERVPGAHLIGSWVGLRAGLDAVARRKIPCPCQKPSPSRQARSLVTILTELFRL
jgi:hypothetical protein